MDEQKQKASVEATPDAPPTDTKIIRETPSTWNFYPSVSSVFFELIPTRFEHEY
jgi:hypothetical protein